MTKYFRFLAFGVLAAVALAFAPGVLAALSLPDIDMLPGLLLAAPTVATPFPIIDRIIPVVQAYRNSEYVADQVLPRNNVGAFNYTYYRWKRGQSYRIMKTLVGRTGRVQEVTFEADEIPGALLDYALDDVVPRRDIMTAMQMENKPDPRMRAGEGTMDLVQLAREYRVATVVTDPDFYEAARKKALAGASRWSNPASDPIEEIMTSLDVPLYRPTHMLVNELVLTALQLNPNVAKRIRGGAGAEPLATEEELAKILRIKKIVVGKARNDKNERGQEENIDRLWPSSCLLYYRDDMSDMTMRSTSMPTYGWTAVHDAEGKFAEEIWDPLVGARGAARIRAGEHCEEHISDKSLAYLLTDVIEP